MVILIIQLIFVQHAYINAKNVQITLHALNVQIILHLIELMILIICVLVLKGILIIIKGFVENVTIHVSLVSILQQIVCNVMILILIGP